MLSSPASAMLLLETLPVARELLLELFAPGLGRGQVARLVLVHRELRLHRGQIVAAEGIGHFPRAESVHAQRLERRTSGTQGGLEGLALDHRDTANAKLEKMRHVARAAHDGQV